MEKAKLLSWIEKRKDLAASERYWSAVIHQQTPEEELPDSRRKEWLGGGVVFNAFDDAVLSRVDSVVVDGFSVLFGPNRSYDFSPEKSPEASLGGTESTPEDLAAGFVRVARSLFDARPAMKTLVLAFEKPDRVADAKRREQFLRDDDDDRSPGLAFSHSARTWVGASNGEPDYYAALKDRKTRSSLVAVLVEEIEHALVAATPFRNDRHSVVLDGGDSGIRWLLSAGKGKHFEGLGESDVSMMSLTSRWLGEGDDSVAYFATLLASRGVGTTVEVVTNDADFAVKAAVVVALTEAKGGELLLRQ